MILCTYITYTCCFLFSETTHSETLHEKKKTCLEGVVAKGWLGHLIAGVELWCQILENQRPPWPLQSHVSPFPFSADATLQVGIAADPGAPW